MDTLATQSSKPDSSNVARLIGQVLGGKDAVVVDPGDSAPFLRDFVLQLEDRGCRVFHVSAALPGGLDLSALLAQVAGEPDLDVQDDDVLDRGFQRLTVPGPGCDRVVLVIEGADLLHDAVFRYLALACRAANELQLVLAGQTDPTTRIGEAAALLHARLSALPAFRIGPAAAGSRETLLPAAVLAGSMVDDAFGVPDVPVPAPGRDSRGQRGAVWIVAGLGMAVSAVAGFGVGWQVRSGYRTGVEASAASTRGDPASSSGQVSAAPITPASNLGSPVPDAVVAFPAPSTAPTPAPPVAAERDLTPPSAVVPTAPPASDAAPAEPSLPTSPRDGAVGPEPNAQARPAGPEQPAAPPADAPADSPAPPAPEHPVAPFTVPGSRNAGQEREPQAAISPPHVRNAIPSPGRTRPSPDTGEHRHRDPPQRRSEPTVQGGPPQGADPPSRPVIGSFVIGPDGTRVFRPNP